MATIAALPELPDITPQEVLELLQRGDPIDGRRITGALQMKKIVWEREVVFLNCEFSAHLDASYAHFKKQARFEKCVLLRGANFDSTQFESDVWLGLALRLPPAEGMTTDRDAELALCLNDVKFLGAVDARGLIIEEGRQLTMERATFDNDAYFSAARVAAAVMEQVRFNRSVLFDGATFGSGQPSQPSPAAQAARVLRFERCTVAGDLSCAGLTCIGASSWERSSVAGKADFTSARLVGETSFQHSRLGELWMLGSSVASKLVLTGTRIEGSLVLQSVNSEGVVGAQSSRWPYEPPELELDGASVGQNAWFEKSQFRTLSAIGLKVGLQASFNDATFHGEFAVYEMAVEFGAFFRGTTFLRSADLSRVRIGGEAYFSGAVFHRGALFNNAVVRVLNFSKEVDDKKVERPPAKVAGLLSFKGLQCGYLDMREVTGFEYQPASGDGKLTETVFPTVLLMMARVESSVVISGGPLCRVSLRHAVIGGELDIENAEIRDELDVLGAMVGTLVLADARLPACVDLRACQYRAIKVDDPTRLLALGDCELRQQPFDRQPFVALATSLRSAGNDRAARAVQIQKHRFDELQARGMSKFRKSIWRYLALYGYSVSLLLFWSALIAAFSAWILAGPNMFEPTPDKVGDTVLAAKCAQPFGYARAAYFAVSRVLPTALPADTTCQPASKVVLTEWSMLGVSIPHVRQPLLAYCALLVVAWVFIPLIVAYYAGLLRRLDT